MSFPRDIMNHLSNKGSDLFPPTIKPWVKREIGFEVSSLFYLGCQTPFQVATPLPSWTKPSVCDLSWLSLPLTLAIHLKNWEKHTYLRYIWKKEKETHREGSSPHPVELNLELQLQHGANRKASHFSLVSDAHHIFIASPGEDR